MSSMRKGWTALKMSVMLPRMSETSRALLRLVGPLAFLAAAIAALTVMGRGALGVPPLFDRAAWGPWVSSRDAVTVVFAGLRVLTLAAAWYLLGATLVGIVARLLRSARLIALADVVTVPAVRRVLQSALGVGFATAALAAGSGSTVSLPARPVAAATMPAASAPATPADIAPRAPAPPIALPVDQPPPPADVAARDPQHTKPRTWTARPGDHFWSIAEDVLARHRDRSPTDDEVAEYWERLVAMNRSQLVDAGNPDLILPGQEFVLPPPPA